MNADETGQHLCPTCGNRFATSDLAGICQQRPVRYNRGLAAGHIVRLRLSGQLVRVVATFVHSFQAGQLLWHTVGLIVAVPGTPEEREAYYYEYEFPTAPPPTREQRAKLMEDVYPSAPPVSLSEEQIRDSLICDVAFQFHVQGWAEKSSCRLRLYQVSIAGLQTHPSFALPSSAAYVVLLTDDENSRGQSITNAASVLLPQVCQTYNLPMERVICIEHYEAEDTFAWVRFRESRVQGAAIRLPGRAFPVENYGPPEWSPLSKEVVRHLTGTEQF